MQELLQRISIERASDGMQASIRPLCGIGDLAPSVDEICNLLQSCGIRHGLSEEQISQFLAAWKRGELAGSWVIARGTPPVAAIPSIVRRLDPARRSGRNAVELLPLYVRKGEAVLYREEGEPGVPGRDVGGAAVPPPGADQIVVPGEGIAEEGQVWRATESGFLWQEGGKISIGATLRHRQDLPPGDYHWPGDARISGGIPRNTRLRLEGSLFLGGDVGDAVTIEADGDVHIGGVIEGGKTTRVEASGDIRAGEVHHAALLAVGDIYVAGGCLHASCRCRGKFIAEASRGRLVGGRVEAVSGAALQEVGDPQGVRTLVTVGRARWIEEEIQTLDQEQRRWVAYTARLVKEYEERFAPILADRARIYRLPEAERMEFEEAREEVLREQARIESRIAELRTLKERLAEARPRDKHAVIRIERAHRDCLFAIADKTFEVTKPLVESLVLSVSTQTRRILPIPLAVYDSSDMANPSTNPVEA
ncbi:MAG: FapA family protein [Planctomycetes bacterium]|nr:FapA family protein [Planctomycetota bacterium]